MILCAPRPESFTRVTTVLFSGGKDSIALLTVLNELVKGLPSELVIITIDEGIADYREDSVKYAKLAAEKFGLEHQIYSFEVLFILHKTDLYKLLIEYRLLEIIEILNCQNSQRVSCFKYIQIIIIFLKSLKKISRIPENFTLNL